MVSIDKLKVTVFVPEYSSKQRNVLRAFAHGVPHSRVRSLSDSYTKCDIAVVFGLVKKSYKETWQKKKIIDKHQDRSLIVIDSAFVNRGVYYNVGFGGINGNADFRNEGVKNDRWLGLSVRSKPWRQNDGGNIVVCGQVPWDTAVQNTDHAEWCRDTVAYYNKLGLRVLFRPHPRIADKWQHYYGDVRANMIDTGPLENTLMHAKCMVTWNSNSAVDAAIRGVPVIAMNSGSGAYDIASYKLSHYNKLRCPSRRQWLAGIGYSQWTLDEMRAGLPWKHLMRDTD